MKGRPLRFAGSVLVGWTMLRIGMIWIATGSLPEAIERGVPLPMPRLANHARPPAPRPIASAPHAPTPRPGERAGPPARTQVAGHAVTEDSIDPRRQRLALAAMTTFGSAHAIDNTTGPPISGPMPRLPPPPDRWRASGWVFYRPGSGGPFRAGLASLGGSQAGMRTTYLLDSESRLSLSLRAASPLSTSGAEVMTGLAWKPFDAPVTLLAEQRFGLDHQRGGPSIALVGGQGPAPVGHGLQLDSYGEVGVIARDRADYFAGGAVRVTRQVATIGARPVLLGLGGWGGIQRGARRLDIGPALTTALPVAGGNARLSLEWRRRVAGNADPGSGLALTLGADF
ncbi:hypothetical protein [Stakelama pacifica]|uniref:Uncharacterized protein n=1 Tax=Stakelama pacifica TaxID=517720 RepID=A0A4R6FVW9_9SPHN|nr:hypothetical protein [Stakelama pacifica]TDN85440.1 hypothetical protein EV664_102146 [Stakelama pacifica]GGO92637.1 hypothetical protein GCM10011329_10210 [Stakelama pacifica]